MVLASDGLWDVVENEVITLPQFSHSSKQAVTFYVNLIVWKQSSITSLFLLFALGLHSFCSQNGQLCSYWCLHLINNNVVDAFMKKGSCFPWEIRGGARVCSSEIDRDCLLSWQRWQYHMHRGPISPWQNRMSRVAANFSCTLLQAIIILQAGWWGSPRFTLLQAIIILQAGCWGFAQIYRSCSNFQELVPLILLLSCRKHLFQQL